jgi:hypothetical protein
MFQRQRASIVIGVAALAVVFAFAYVRFSAEAPVSGTVSAPVRTEDSGAASGTAKPVSVPVTVDGVVDGLAEEVSEDESAFREEIGSSTLDAESAALSDITQSYDENEF